jgi:DNA polymerase-1
MIALDIETYDSNLKTLGDGSVRKDGSILCVGMYDGNTAKCYTPDDQEMIERLASDEPKIAHNGVYDYIWLSVGYGYKIGGVMHDTMTRTALIDEYADLSLDACCKKFKVPGKNSMDTIDNWYLENKKQYQMTGNMWDNLSQAWVVIPEARDAIVRYNLQDCKACYNLFMAQEPFMRELQEPYELECKLYPLIIQMKRVGIRLDTVQRDMLIAEIEAKLRNEELQLKNLYNITAETIASPKKLTIAMNMLGVRSPVSTATGGQSWNADALELIDHPACTGIQAVKTCNALLSKGLNGSFKTMLVNDRLHCTFSPNKRDDGGTITGRMASSKPNLQQVTAREEKHGQKTYGQEIRSMFLPEEGYMLGAFDYSAIEFRLLAHYAAGQQAEWFREQIIAGKDPHKMAQELTGIESRDVIKRMNFGFIYGMGVRKLVTINRILFKKLAGDMDIYAYGTQVAELYKQKFPVMADTMRSIERQVQAAGYIKGIGGRMHHKPKPVYENGRWNSGIYKMTNYQIQGSAAEILKRGLVNAYEAGLFDTLVPHLLVHDEVVVSVPYNKIGTEAGLELQRCMESAFNDRLTVPMKVAADVGPNWGAWDSPIWSDMQTGKFDVPLC